MSNIDVLPAEGLENIILTRDVQENDIKECPAPSQIGRENTTKKKSFNLNVSIEKDYKLLDELQDNAVSDLNSSIENADMPVLVESQENSTSTSNNSNKNDEVLEGIDKTREVQTKNQSSYSKLSIILSFIFKLLLGIFLILLNFSIEKRGNDVLGILGCIPIVSSILIAISVYKKTLTMLLSSILLNLITLFIWGSITITLYQNKGINAIYGRIFLASTVLCTIYTITSIVGYLQMKKAVLNVKEIQDTQQHQ